MKARDPKPGAPQSWASRARHLLLLIALLVPPLVMRFTQISDRQVSLGMPDMRGFLADLTTAMVLALVLGSIGTRLRVLRTAVALVWTLSCYGNYESIRALGSMLTLDYMGYLGDSIFLQGSALAPAHPLLLGGLTILSVGSIWLAGARQPSRFRVAPLGGLAALLIGIQFIWPIDWHVASWRQTNFLYANVGTVIEQSTALARSRPTGDVGIFVPELDGEPIVEFGKRGQNVLLIMLEGISTAHMPSYARTHGYEDLPTRMPRLEALAREQLTFSTFVAHQRQTNRGEYSVLCGELPKLFTEAPKMSELVGKGPLACLPAALRAEGYQTVYLQAAPLPFMFKDQFMLQAGYTRVYGDEYFETAYSRSHWGVDDRAYFEQVLAEIDVLQSGDKPWFLTLLTVGTHHPYMVPESFEGEARKGTFGWAVEYLDVAFEPFMGELEKRGVLEDTLVVITSDESNGIQIETDDISRMLSQAWGLLSVRLPSGERLQIDEPFTQADLPISILDYLGYRKRALTFNGRSVFRHYETSRPLFWANTYLKMIAGVDPAGDLVVCPESFVDCKQFTVADGRFFGPQRTETDGEAERLLQQVAELSRSTPAGAVNEFDLVATPEFSLEPRPHMQFIFGGQYLVAERGTRIDVELEFRLEGRTGAAIFRHDLVSRGETPHFNPAPVRMSTGQTAKYHYSYLAGRDLDRIEIRLMMRILGERRVTVRFKSAHVTLTPGAGGPPGVTKREISVRPPNRQAQTRR